MTWNKFKQLSFFFSSNFLSWTFQHRVSLGGKDTASSRYPNSSESKASVSREDSDVITRLYLGTQDCSSCHCVHWTYLDLQWSQRTRFSVVFVVFVAMGVAYDQSLVLRWLVYLEPQELLASHHRPTGYKWGNYCGTERIVASNQPSWDPVHTWWTTQQLKSVDLSGLTSPSVSETLTHTSTVPNLGLACHLVLKSQRWLQTQRMQRSLL